MNIQFYQYSIYIISLNWFLAKMTAILYLQVKYLCQIMNLADINLLSKIIELAINSATKKTKYILNKYVAKVSCIHFKIWIMNYN